MMILEQKVLQNNATNQNKIFDTIRGQYNKYVSGVAVPKNETRTA